MGAFLDRIDARRLVISVTGFAAGLASAAFLAWTSAPIA